jgi:DNA-binding NarL/FixJ family response regulator
MINIAFFEDHPIVQNSLISLFTNQPDLNLVFFASTKSDLYDTIQKHPNLNIIIIDLLANDVQGLEVYEYLNKNYPEINIISFTSLSSPILVENLLSAGAKGYVNKNQDIEDLVEAIRKVSKGEIYLPDDYLFLTKKYTANTSIALTERETEIMQLIIMEFTTADIARQLQLSTNTVENHRKSIFYKFNVKNVAGMVREAFKLGYVS